MNQVEELTQFDVDTHAVEMWGEDSQDDSI